jgi:hypothetical protein
MTDDADSADDANHAEDADPTPRDEGDGDPDAPLSDLAGRRRARREERESARAGGEEDAGDPFSALGRDADATATDRDPTAEPDDAFEQMDVEPVDSEDVWDDLLKDDADTTDGGGTAQGEGTAGSAGTGGTVESAADTDTVTAVEEPAGTVGAETADAEVGESESAAVDAAEVGEKRDPREEHVIPKADYCQQCEYFTDPPEVACEHERTDIVSVEDFEHFRVRGCPVVENEFEPGEGNY